MPVAIVGRPVPSSLQLDAPIKVVDGLPHTIQVLLLVCNAKAVTFKPLNIALLFEPPHIAVKALCGRAGSYRFLAPEAFLDRASFQVLQAPEFV